MEKKFEKRPNSGALFVVKSKKNPMQPDYRGDLIINLTDFDIVDGKVSIEISGWKKNYSGGTLLSLQAKKFYVKQGEQQQSNDGGNDDDIPF
jgi:hypothetical protein